MSIKKHRNIFKERLNEMFGEKLADLIMYWSVVHHKDGNRKNNNISNLKLMTQEEHTSLHHAGRRKINENK